MSSSGSASGSSLATCACGEVFTYEAWLGLPRDAGADLRAPHAPTTELRRCCYCLQLLGWESAPPLPRERRTPKISGVVGLDDVPVLAHLPKELIRANADAQRLAALLDGVATVATLARRAGMEDEEAVAWVADLASFGLVTFPNRS